MEERKTTVEKRTEVTREERVADPKKKTTNVNVGPDGTTNVQESGDTVVEEEHVVEEHEHQP